MDSEESDDSNGAESLALFNLLQETNFKCKFCNQSFSSQSTLVRHERTHTGERPGQNELTQPEDAEFACEVCSESFDFESALMKHWNSHPDEELFSCSLCDMRFSQSSQLRKHKNTHAVPENHRCEYCNRCFTSGPNLARHKVMHPEYRRSIGAKPARCWRCSKRFSRRDYLKRHLRLHCVDKPFQCKICLKSFRSESSLSEHQRKHSENPDKTDQLKEIKCKVCSKTYTRWRSLDMHVRLQHSGAQIHKCEHCEKTFAYSYNLSRHRKQHFIEKKSFPCEDCHRSYTRRDSLMNHRKIHLGLMRYRCNRCSVLFEHKDKLDRHKQKHANELPRQQRPVAKRVISDDGKSHQCKHCPMSFKRKVDLQRHDKAHSIHNVKISIRSTESNDDKSSEYFHPNDEDYDYTLNTELAQVDHDLDLPYTEHLGLIKYRCDRCSMLFELEDQLNLHKKKHMDELTCQQRLVAKHILPEVKDSYPDNGKSYQCKHCPMSFKCKEDLKRHDVAHNIPKVKIFIGSVESPDETNDKTFEDFHPDDKDYDFTLNTELGQVEHDLNLSDTEQSVLAKRQQNSFLQTEPVLAMRRYPVDTTVNYSIDAKLEPEVLLKEFEIKKEPVDDYEKINTSPVIINAKPVLPVSYNVKPALSFSEVSSGTVEGQSNKKGITQKKKMNGALDQANKSNNFARTQLTRISMKAPRSYISFRNGRRYAQFSIFKTSET